MCAIRKAVVFAISCISLASAVTGGANAARAQEPDYGRFVPPEPSVIWFSRPGDFHEHALVERIRERFPAVLHPVYESFENRGVPLDKCDVYFSCIFGEARRKDAAKDIDMMVSKFVYVGVLAQNQQVDQAKALATGGFVEAWERIQRPFGTYWKARYEGYESFDGTIIPSSLNHPAVAQCRTFPADHIYIETTEVCIREVLTGRGNNAWTRRLAELPAENIFTIFLGPETIAEIKADLDDEDAPPAIAPLLPLADKVELVEIAFALDADALMTASFQTSSVEDAKAVEQGAHHARNVLRGLATLLPLQASTEAGLRETSAFALHLLDDVSIAIEETTVRITLPKPENLEEKLQEPLAELNALVIAMTEEDALDQ